MKRKDFFFRLAADLFLLVPGLLGSVFCLITAFSLPFSSELWIVAAGSLLVFSLLLGNQKQDRVSALILLAFLLIAGYLTRRELLEGFRNLWGILCSLYAKGYNFFLDYIPEEPVSPEGVGAALLALTILEAYLCCLAVRTWKRTTPMALTLLICIGPCFVLTDTPPDTLPLMAAAFSILAQAFSQSVRRREEGEHIKAVSVAAVLSAALLGLMLMLFPRDSYSPPITWAQMSKKIEQLGRQVDNQGNANAGLTGDQDAVDLSSLGALPNRPIPILYALSTEDAYLYLRGSSYNEFDGTYWGRGEEGEWAQTALFPYLGRRGGASLVIETVDTEDLIYTPYQLTQLAAGSEVVSDTHVRNPSDTTHYNLSFVLDPPPVVPAPEYDAWVRDVCMRLPSRSKAGVLNWWYNQEQVPSELDHAPGNDDPEGQLRFAHYVAEQVSRHGSYSRNPARMPAGADFCTWFLNEAESGYCVHYASACTVLLRALGIPARYVSGYVCDAVANEQARVTNLQAHAWVEVWIGGRWIPVEPTPADATEFTGILPESSHNPNATGETAEPEYTRPDRPRPGGERETPTTEPSAVVGPGAGPAATPQSEPVDLTLLWVFLGIISVPALILGRRRLMLRHWDKRVAAAKSNEQALLLYKRILRLKKLGGGKPSAAAVALAKKACYSQHELSEKELGVLRQTCDEQTSRLRICGFWKRQYCKYVLCVI